MENANQKKLEQLLQEMDQCRDCQQLFGFEPRPIHHGNFGAKIMHISQAPGKRVHESGKPFDDLSGKRLRQWYQVSDEAFYDPDNFYFTTMGHCYPGKGKNNYDNKPPRCCYDKWTKHEIDWMDQAQLYLIVGSEAASRVFPKEKLTDLVFKDHFLHGKPCYVLPHPSPLNRRWLMAHPEFEKERLPLIRRKIQEVLNQKKAVCENVQSDKDQIERKHEE